jgi:hypothetical protein
MIPYENTEHLPGLGQGLSKSCNDQPAGRVPRMEPKEPLLMWRYLAFPIQDSRLYACVSQQNVNLHLEGPRHLNVLEVRQNIQDKFDKRTRRSNGLDSFRHCKLGVSVEQRVPFPVVRKGSDTQGRRQSIRHSDRIERFRTM